MLPGSIHPPDIYTDIPSELQVAAIAEGIQRVRDCCKIGAALSIVDYPFWAPILRQVPNTVVVYDCMDAYASFANAGRPARELEREAVRNADIVACSSEHLRNSMRRFGRESMLVRNGVTVSHFEQRPQPLAFERTRPTAGYWGATAEWTDIELLIHAARQLPDVDFVMIGEVMRVEYPNWLRCQMFEWSVRFHTARCRRICMDSMSAFFPIAYVNTPLRLTR